MGEKYSINEWIYIGLLEKWMLHIKSYEPYVQGTNMKALECL